MKFCDVQLVWLVEVNLSTPQASFLYPLRDCKMEGLGGVEHIMLTIRFYRSERSPTDTLSATSTATSATIMDLVCIESQKRNCSGQIRLEVFLAS